MKKTLKERAESTAQWILRRESLLKAANIKQLIQAELEEQRKIDYSSENLNLIIEIYEEYKSYIEDNPVTTMSFKEWFDKEIKAMEENK